jgi:hypothetical protein
MLIVDLEILERREPLMYTQDQEMIMRFCLVSVSPRDCM